MDKNEFEFYFIISCVIAFGVVEQIHVVGASIESILQFQIK